MNIENEDNGTKICPYCAEQIKQAAIKCKHCGEFLVAEKTPSEIDIVDSESPLQSKTNLRLYVFLLGAVFLHVIFCAESPLIFISASNPISSLVYSLAYSIPAMLISIILLVPIINYCTKDNVGKNFFKGFTLKSVTIALYFGAVFRLVLFISKFII